MKTVEPEAAKIYNKHWHLLNNAEKAVKNRRMGVIRIPPQLRENFPNDLFYYFTTKPPCVISDTVVTERFTSCGYKVYTAKRFAPNFKPGFKIRNLEHFYELLKAANHSVNNPKQDIQGRKKEKKTNDEDDIEVIEEFVEQKKTDTKSPKKRRESNSRSPKRTHKEKDKSKERSRERSKSPTRKIPKSSRRSNRFNIEDFDGYHIYKGGQKSPTGTVRKGCKFIMLRLKRDKTLWVGPIYIERNFKEQTLSQDILSLEEAVIDFEDKTRSYEKQGSYADYDIYKRFTS